MNLYNFSSKIVIYILNLLKFIGIHIRINELETRAIGHFSVSIELYLLSKKKNLNKKYFDIWFRNKFISNDFLYNFWKKKFKIFPPYFFLRIIFNMIIKEKKFEYLIPVKHWKTHKNIHSDLKNILGKNKPIITFEKHEILHSQKMLNKVNFNFEKNFFCIHNRDNKYRKSNNELDSLTRNFKISSYNRTLKLLSNKDLGIVRMGNNCEDKITFNNGFIFDYASNKKIQSPLLDFYIVSKSKFYVTGDSGANSVPRMFRIPILGINVFPYIIQNWNNQNFKLVIFKKLYSHLKKRLLNYREVLEITDKKTCELNKKKVEQLKISIIDNTEKEIYELINEHILKLNGKWNEKKNSHLYYKILNKFYKKNYNIKLKNINIGYNFLVKNIKLFDC